MPPMVAVKVRVERVAASCGRCGSRLMAEKELVEAWAEAHLDLQVDAVLLSIDDGPACWWRRCDGGHLVRITGA
jgi:hypothetical protein